MNCIRECIKALRMVSLEDPVRVLKAKCLPVVINFIQFTDDGQTQKSCVEIIHNVSRAPATEQEFRESILPVLPDIAALLY